MRLPLRTSSLTSSSPLSLHLSSLSSCHTFILVCFFYGFLREGEEVGYKVGESYFLDCQNLIILCVCLCVCVPMYSSTQVIQIIIIFMYKQACSTWKYGCLTNPRLIAMDAPVPALTQYSEVVCYSKITALTIKFIS